MSDRFHIHLHGPNRGPLSASFESAAERLEGLAKLYLEGDGSFVWARDGGREKVYGMLYDAAGVLQYVELRGDCRQETLRRVITAIEPDRQSIQVLRLPDGEWQNLQSFENRIWG